MPQIHNQGFPLLGNSGKTCHPWNVEFDEIHEINFQGGWIYDDLEPWTYEPRSREPVKIWNLEPAKPRLTNLWRSGILNLRSPKVANLWRSGISNLRSPEVANLWRSGILNLRSPEVADRWRSGIMNLRSLEVASLWKYGVMNLWHSGIHWCPNLGVAACEDFHEWESHELVRSQVKDVSSKVWVWRVNLW
jgi:hypothetical protein